jgi:cardiolipin synthase A/B
MQRIRFPRRKNQTKNNRVKLVKGGSEFFELLIRIIGEATETVHLQTYIFDDDETGKMVIDALKAAATRKVQVYVLADGFASQSLSKAFIENLKAEGVNFRLFEPLFKSKNFYFGRRLHHKIVAIDSRYALVGGINISNKYNDRTGAPAWLDFALFAEGDIAKQLCVLCRKTWKGFPALKPEARMSPCKENPSPAHISESDNCIVRIRRNDWLRQKNEISRSYISMFRNSKSRITILSSYFLPGQFFRQSIKKAVKRGVSLRIIIAGRSDVLFSKNAERYWYDWLLRNNIEIYEYNKNVLHGKLAVCDGSMMTLGSFNVNDLSTYASIELNLEVHHSALVISTEKMLEEIIINDCTRITERLFHTRNVFTRISQWASYQIVHTLFKLCTFHFNHQE